MVLVLGFVFIILNKLGVALFLTDLAERDGLRQVEPDWKSYFRCIRRYRNHRCKMPARDFKRNRIGGVIPNGRDIFRVEGRCVAECRMMLPTGGRSCF